MPCEPCLSQPPTVRCTPRQFRCSTKLPISVPHAANCNLRLAAVRSVKFPLFALSYCSTVCVFCKPHHPSLSLDTRFTSPSGTTSLNNAALIYRPPLPFPRPTSVQTHRLATLRRCLTTPPTLPPSCMKCHPTAPAFLKPSADSQAAVGHMKTHCQ